LHKLHVRLFALFALAALLIHALPAVAAPQGPTDPEELERFLDAFFLDKMEQLDIPGAAFVLVKDGEIFFAKGYGYADLRNKVPVDPRATVFRIGSTSKLFTASAVMQLVESGEIDLGEDVNHYLERFQLEDAFPDPVTMAHLLTHTAGFNERDIGVFARTPAELAPLGQYLAEHMPARVLPPGEITSYSNHGLALAGYIVEIVSSMPFEQYVAENILAPLGMAHSSFEQPLPPELSAALAAPYPRDLERGPLLYTPIAPAGMLSTTAYDMARFMIAHLQNGHYGDVRILEETTTQTMHQRHFANHPDIPGWAYGFTERVENGQRVLDHGGADPSGYGSMLVLLPEQNLGFFTVVNSVFQDDLLMALPEAFLDHYYPQEDIRDPQPLPGFQNRAAQLSGTYFNNRYDRLSFSKLSLISKPPVRVQIDEARPGAVLVTGLTSQPSRWLEIEPLLFQREGSEERIAFGEDEKGRVAHLFAVVHTPGAFDKAAWYQTPAFHQMIMLACLLIFLSLSVGWPLVALFYRLRKQDRQFSRATRQARWLAFAVSALNLVFMVLAMLLLSTSELQFGVPPELVALFVAPLLTTALTVGLPILGVRAWQDKAWSILGRLHYAVVTLAALVFIWWMAYWNLLGFHF